jgi:hypothetical protein
LESTALWNKKATTTKRRGGRTNGPVLEIGDLLRRGEEVGAGAGFL